MLFSCFTPNTLSILPWSPWSRWICRAVRGQASDSPHICVRTCAAISGWCRAVSCYLQLIEKSVLRSAVPQHPAGLPCRGCLWLLWRSAALRSAPLGTLAPLSPPTHTGEGGWKADKSGRRGLSCCWWLQSNSHISLGSVGQVWEWRHLWGCDQMVLYP